MGFLLPFAVLGYAFVLHAAWRRQAELALLAAVSGMVAALYLSALGGILYEGSWLVFLAGLACFLITLWGLWHDRQPDRPKVAEGFLSPGIVLFLVLSLLFRLFFADARLQLWDEFSHWGVMTREMLALGGLPGPVGAIIFKDYPPGANLLHFWAATIAGSSEGTFYQAHFMLLLAPALAFCSRLSWRQPGWLGLNLLMVAAITTTLSVFVCSLMVDVVLALHLAAGLYLAAGAVIWRKRALLFLPILFSLPLIKNTGAFFAWMILSLLLVNSLVQAVSIWRADRRALARPWREQLASYHPGRGRIVALLLTFSLLVAAPLTAPATWKAHLVSLHIDQSFKTAQIGAPEMLATFTKDAPERSTMIRDRFIAALSQQSLSNYVEEGRSFMAWIGLGKLVPGFSLTVWLGFTGLLILAGFLRHRAPDLRARMVELWLIMAIFGVLYLAGLIILYIFSFSEYEGPHLASFGRYVNTMLIPTVLLAWGWCLPFADESEEDQARWGGPRRWVYLACLGLFGLALVTQAPSWPGLPRWSAVGDAHEDHAYVEPLAEVVRKVVPPDKRVFVVYQNTPGRPFHIIRYEIAPRPTNQWFFTLGEPYFEGDVWSENLSLADFAKMLSQGYDFLFLARSDQQFWDRYRPLFAPGTRPYRDIIFKVVPGGQHGVILVPAGARPPRRG